MHDGLASSMGVKVSNVLVSSSLWLAAHYESRIRVMGLQQNLPLLKGQICSSGWEIAVIGAMFKQAGIGANGTKPSSKQDESTD